MTEQVFIIVIPEINIISHFLPVNKINDNQLSKKYKR